MSRNKTHTNVRNTRKNNKQTAYEQKYNTYLFSWTNQNNSKTYSLYILNKDRINAESSCKSSDFCLRPYE